MDLWLHVAPLPLRHPALHYGHVHRRARDLHQTWYRQVHRSLTASVSRACQFLEFLSKLFCMNYFPRTVRSQAILCCGPEVLSTGGHWRGGPHSLPRTANWVLSPEASDGELSYSDPAHHSLCHHQVIHQQWNNFIPIWNKFIPVWRVQILGIVRDIKFQFWPGTIYFQTGMISCQLEWLTSKTISLH